jgi:hypothetical protein
VRPEIQEQFQAEYLKCLKRHPEYAWLFGQPDESEIRYVAELPGKTYTVPINGADLNSEIRIAAQKMADMKQTVWFDHLSGLLKESNHLGQITLIENSMLDVAWHLACEKGRGLGVSKLTTWGYVLHPKFENMINRHEDRGRGHILYHASNYFLSEQVPEDKGIIMGDFKSSPMALYEKRKPQLEYVHEKEVKLGDPPFSVVASATYAVHAMAPESLFWFDILR